jgi:prepilin-type N-terminal cleavage/methylation domain-containing protein
MTFGRMGDMSLRGREDGFTLVESLVATMILGIGIVGASGMFSYATISERKATYMAESQDISVRAIENVRAGNYGVFDELSGTSVVPVPELPNGTGLLAWEPYGSTGSPQLKLVVLQLTWDSGGPSAGRHRVVTLVRDASSG